MTREELEAALEGHFPESWGPFEANDITHAAARKQLALMPEKCGTCGGSRWVDGGHRGATTSEVCPTCHGSGKVYPPETVETFTLAILAAFDHQGSYCSGDDARAAAVAVLDARGETP